MGKRMTISLSPKLDEDLKAIIDSKVFDVRNKSEAFRNAIVLYKLVVDEAEKGNKLAFIDENNNIVKEII